MSKKILALLLSLMMLCTLTACGSSEDTPAGDNNKEASQVKVGFIYIGSIGDEGWTDSHNNARLELEKTLGVETAYMENVPENADCEAAIRSLIDQGCNVIFTTSFGFGEWTQKAAQEYPDVYFLHASGYLQEDNMSNYFGRMYQPRYLSGIAAGLKTQSNKIGYVAAMAIPEVIRGIDAFTLGVRSVNPDATVEVLWTGAWGDAALEKAAAQQLINNGCDVLAKHQDTSAVLLAAEEAGVACIGYHYPTLDVAPNTYLTAPVWNWAPYYIAQVKAIMDGTWKSESYWSNDVVALDKLSANCAQGTAEAIAAAQEQIDSGEWDVFTGPITNQAGEIAVPEGKTLTDEEMLNLNWFVQGVIGTIQ